jgi:hypothetical protein
MSGNPQEGTADDVAGTETVNEAKANQNAVEAQNAAEPGTARIEFLDELRDAPRVEFRPMGPPLLPPKPP